MVSPKCLRNYCSASPQTQQEYDSPLQVAGDRARDPPPWRSRGRHEIGWNPAPKQGIGPIANMPLAEREAPDARRGNDLSRIRGDPRPTAGHGCPRENDRHLDDPSTSPIASTLLSFDAFGVLNLGERLIEGADRRLEDLRARDVKIRVLTNAASYDRAGRGGRPGGENPRPPNSNGSVWDCNDSEIVTSREAGPAWAAPPGVLGGDRGPTPDRPWRYLAGPASRLGGCRGGVTDAVDAFLFFSAADWTEERQKLLVHFDGPPGQTRDRRQCRFSPRPKGTGFFTLEPGHFGHRLEDAFRGCRCRLFSEKPFEAVYHLCRTDPARCPAATGSRCAGDTAPHRYRRRGRVRLADRGW